jgi:hypothetical protein
VPWAYGDRLLLGIEAEQRRHRAEHILAGDPLNDASARVSGVLDQRSQRVSSFTASPIAARS